MVRVIVNMLTFDLGIGLSFLRARTGRGYKLLQIRPINIRSNNVESCEFVS